jgi:hypothetical protein
VSELHTSSSRYVSLTELGTLCQFGFRVPIHLCPFVIEEGGNGEGERSEEPSLLSYTLRHVSLVELDTLCQFGFREPMNLCVRPFPDYNEYLST